MKSWRRLLFVVSCPVSSATESVSSAADMEKLRSHLGAYYDQGVFELTNDIFIDGDWAPIGTSLKGRQLPTFASA